ncbi:hypothetical protein A1D23_13090 [Chelonobacter oris]|uniref:DUF935 domain-containing protein n=1 Tax=Chelonobacter oris TaxID=505317 RepID=UPI002447702E|nr:DUF935 family protein [Chelonobacter oris]MDH3001473.1 hypothetical protein [Chelonobacter oris]
MATKKQDLVRTIATRAQAVDYWAIGYHLPNPDPVLKLLGRDISAYREVLVDPHVGGCVRRRKAAVKSLEWRLTPSGNQAVDVFLAEVFARLPLPEIIGEILDAPLFGYQALEVDWVFENQCWQPRSVIGKPQEWFVFDEDNTLRLRTKEHRLKGVIPPEKKFLLATQGASYLNPYGRADLSLCFWAATFKKGGFKFWYQFVEKYGAPWMLGKYPRQASPKEIEDLLDAMDAMLGTAVGAIPLDSTAEIMEPAGKGASSDTFERFMKACKAEIAIAILGQNQTTEAEANRASATAGLEVTRDIRDDDASIVENCLNQLLKWICELNFNVDVLPQFELFEQESIDKLQAERDQLLSTMGVRFTPQYLKRTYNFEDGDIIETVPTKSTEFADPIESAVHPIADGIIEQLEVEAEPFVESWFQDIRDQLGEADSIEDFRDRLDSLIPELTFSEYGKVIAWASTTAFLAGKQAVNAERKK